MKIAFICTGNTCRSPMAKGIFTELLRSRGITDIEVYSAGVYAHSGDHASENAIKAAAELSADISMHCARILSGNMLESYDMFVCMSQEQADMIVYPSKEKVRVLGDGIPDPYGGSLEDYRNCAAQIKIELEKLLDEIIAE